MRHAQVSTTMNIYGNALMEAKRDANSSAVKMVMQPNLVLIGVEPTPGGRMPAKILQDNVLASHGPVAQMDRAAVS